MKNVEGATTIVPVGGGVAATSATDAKSVAAGVAPAPLLSAAPDRVIGGDAAEVRWESEAKRSEGGEHGRRSFPVGVAADDVLSPEDAVPVNGKDSRTSEPKSRENGNRMSGDTLASHFRGGIENLSEESEAMRDTVDDASSRWRDERCFAGEEHPSASGNAPTTATVTKNSPSEPSWYEMQADAQELFNLAKKPGIIERHSAKQALFHFVTILREGAKVSKKRHDEMLATREAEEVRIAVEREAAEAKAANGEKSSSDGVVETSAASYPGGDRDGRKRDSGAADVTGGDVVPSQSVAGDVKKAIAAGTMQELPPSTSSSRKRPADEVLAASGEGEEESSSQKSLATRSSEMPLLKPKDKWVKHNGTSMDSHCLDFDTTGTCPLGKGCTKLHILRPERRMAVVLSSSTLDRKTDDPSGEDGENKADEAQKSREAEAADKIIEETVKAASGELGYEPFNRDDLVRAYRVHRKFHLKLEHFMGDKVKADLFDCKKSASGFRCPIDNVYYYAWGGKNGMKSQQGIWWYPNMKEARDAVSRVAVTDLKQRGIFPATFRGTGESEMRTAKLGLKKKAKTSIEMVRGFRVANQTAMANYHANAAVSAMPFARPLTMGRPSAPSAAVACASAASARLLPNIEPSNWMETMDFGAMERCHAFGNSVCPRNGFVCDKSHVHFPKNVRTDSVPSRGAMLEAYRVNFGKSVLPQGTMAHKFAQDSVGRIWFTAGFRCPVEGTMYYAAGGLNSNVNGQNICLYPTRHDAEAASAGIVLTSFSARGLRVEWTFRSIENNPPRGNQPSTFVVPTLVQSNGVNRGYPGGSANGGALPIQTQPPFLPTVLASGELAVLKSQNSLCRNFQLYRSCKFGSSCRNNHIFVPTIISRDDPKEDLGLIYKTHRGTPLAYSDFKSESKSDQHGRIWYAVAFTCPVERIIYFSFGGSPSLTPGATFDLSSDGTQWYQSHEAAKSALTGIVLASLRARGIIPAAHQAALPAVTPQAPYPMHTLCMPSYMG